MELLNSIKQPCSLICNSALNRLMHSEIVKAEILLTAKISHVEHLKYIFSRNIITLLNTVKAVKRERIKEYILYVGKKTHISFTCGSLIYIRSRIIFSLIMEKDITCEQFSQSHCYHMFRFFFTAV